MKTPFTSRRKVEYRESSFDVDKARNQYNETQGKTLRELYYPNQGESSSHQAQNPIEQPRNPYTRPKDSSRPKDPSLEANWSEGSQFGGSERQASFDHQAAPPQSHPLSFTESRRRNDALPPIPNAQEYTRALYLDQENVRRTRQGRNQPPRGNTDRILDYLNQEAEQERREPSQEPEELVSSPTSISPTDSLPPYTEFPPSNDRR